MTFCQKNRVGTNKGQSALIRDNWYFWRKLVSLISAHHCISFKIFRAWNYPKNGFVLTSHYNFFYFLSQAWCTDKEIIQQSSLTPQHLYLIQQLKMKENILVSKTFQIFIGWAQNEISHYWLLLMKKLFPPGLEPGTFRVLGERDNHYTTETWRLGTPMYI